MAFHSQDKQDYFLETEIFKGYKNGFFVDVGAHDGISLNNTLYFENTNNWKGINIEPIPEVFEKLKDNRPNSINLNCAVYSKEGNLPFYRGIGYTEMLSGLTDTYDRRHFNRMTNENNQYNAKTEVITVPTRRLENILKEHGVKHINYLSVDVEGGEFEVVKSIDFSKVFVDVIGFENNYHDTSPPIVEFLNNNNFELIKANVNVDIFMVNRESKFYKADFI